MDKQMILWAIVFAVSVIIEIASMQLISIWFAVGALAAFIASFFLSFELQLVIFAAATGLMLVATRPLIKKLRRPAVPTNHDLDVGETARVIEDIDSSQNTGRVKLRGVDWTAVSEDNSIIKAGESVKVVKIQGAHLVVSYDTSSFTSVK